MLDNNISREIYLINMIKGLLSEREMELPDIEIEKLLKILNEDKGIISLGPGQPDFGPPKHVTNAACKALRRGEYRYSPVQGRRELLEAITVKLKKENKINLSPENIIVTCGSNEAILIALMSTIDPGEQVLVPDPCFLDFIPAIELLNGQAISIPTYQNDNFQLTGEMIREQIKEPKKTRAIIINTPCNPTGAVYSKKVLEEVATIAREYNLLIISDEAYEKFVYKGKHISIGSLNGMSDHVLTMQSFSKQYGMPGLRVGYAAGPKKIIETMCKLHVHTSLCAPTVSQLAAVDALKGKQEYQKHIKEYDKRRKFIVKRINEIRGFYCNEPEGAFYAFPRFDFKMSSHELCRWLIKNAKVAVAPGSDFGRYGEGFIRLSYATDMKKIEIAMDRIEKATKKLKNR